MRKLERSERDERSEHSILTRNSSVFAPRLASLAPHAAVDTLLQLTAHEGFDWFAALPETLPLKEKKDVISLHRGFLNIRDSNFVSNMLKNAPWNPSFPGGSYLILQILAFWMSWVRAQHCDNNVLYLSNEVLESLRKWKECEVYEMDGEEVTTTGRVLQEEKELAKRLFGDFSRFVGHEFRTDDPLIFGDKKEVLDSWRGSISAEEVRKKLNPCFHFLHY